MEEDPWCAYTPKKEEAIKPDSFKLNRIATGEPSWTEEAEERLKKVPFFVRSMVRGAVERYAVENHCEEITSKIMVEAKGKLCRSH